MVSTCVFKFLSQVLTFKTTFFHFLSFHYQNNIILNLYKTKHLKTKTLASPSHSAALSSLSLSLSLSTHSLHHSLSHIPASITLSHSLSSGVQDIKKNRIPFWVSDPRRRRPIHQFDQLQFSFCSYKGIPFFLFYFFFIFLFGNYVQNVIFSTWSSWKFIIWKKLFQCGTWIERVKLSLDWLVWWQCWEVFIIWKNGRSCGDLRLCKRMPMLVRVLLVALPCLLVDVWWF